MDTIHTIEKGGFKLEIIRDEYPPNPREEFDTALHVKLSKTFSNLQS